MKLQENKVYNMNFLDNNLPDKCANLIIADPPYFEVKGAFDFVWKDFNEYLKDVYRWAIECKRLLADNGTLFWYGDAKNIAYTQVILDEHFELLNNLVWENTNQHKQQIRYSDGLRSFAPLTERILMYSSKIHGFMGREFIEKEYIAPHNPFSIYLKEQFEKAKVTNRQIAKLFPSATGGLTGCVSNWLNGDNVITKEQYLKIREYLGSQYLSKEYEALRQEYEALRRPFDNFRKFGDVIRLPNYETVNYDHDTIKPEELTRTLILTCSRANDLVVVPFAGSGTEHAMAIKEGRRSIAFDIEKKYVDMSNKRANVHLMSPALF